MIENFEEMLKTKDLDKDLSIMAIPEYSSADEALHDFKEREIMSGIRSFMREYGITECIDEDFMEAYKCSYDETNKKFYLVSDFYGYDLNGKFFRLSATLTGKSLVISKYSNEFLTNFNVDTEDLIVRLYTWPL